MANGLNMEVLLRTRKLPRAGDIFVYRLKSFDYGFGRVIRSTTAVVPGLTLYVVFLYPVTSKDKSSLPTMSYRKLLVPPQIIGREMWTQGLFETVCHVPLTKADAPPVLCFHRAISLDPWADEFGRKLRRRTKPCGDFAWASIGHVDFILSKALGIAPHPDTLDFPFRGFDDVPEDDEAIPKRGRTRRAPHAVIVFLSLVRMRSARNPCDYVYGIEDALEVRLTATGVGEVDGHEFALDLSSATLHLEGPDADALADVALPVVRCARPLKGSYILKRYGGASAREVRINL